MSIKEFEHICGNIKSGNRNKNNTDNPCIDNAWFRICLLYTSPSPRARQKGRMPASA